MIAKGAGALLLAASLLPAPRAAARSTAPPARPALAADALEALLEELVPQVERIRGLRFREKVHGAIASGEDVRRYAADRLARFYPEAERRVLEEAWRLLGLLEPGEKLERRLLDALEEQVAGFYDPATKRLYLRDRLDLALARLVAAHELAHALEDQHFDLDSRLEKARGNEDLGFAVSAVHEGSATLVMALYVASQAASGALRSEDLQALLRLEAERAAKLNALPPILRRQLLAGYAVGLSFLLRGSLQALAGGFPGPDVERAYRDGPVSSEQILHPEKYWDEAARDGPREVQLGDLSRVLGRRWRRAGGDVLGELSLGCLVGAEEVDPLSDASVLADAARWSHEAVAGWGGDRWELWTDGRSSVLALKAVWDSAADAEQFVAALPRGADWTVARRGDTVALVAGRGPRRAGKILSHLLRGD